MSETETMEAAFIRQLGTPECIEYGNLPIPVPGPDEVLVAFEASEVNRVDLFVRSGAYRTDVEFPFVIGRDLVGRVVASGPDAPGFQPGQMVWTNSMGHGGRKGTFAEFTAVPADRLYPLPDGVAPRDAAPMLHTAATAHIGLFQRAMLEPGQTVFVGGAAGGVGSAVTQMAADAGVRVIATASPDDFGWCRSCGAAETLDYHSPNLPDQVRDLAPEGVHLWWDTSGHHDLEATLPLMAQRGTMLLMAGIRASTKLPVGDLYTRDLSLVGFAISNATVDELASAADAINRLLAEGRLTARVGATMTLSQAREAHELLESGGVRGRILIV